MNKSEMKSRGVKHVKDKRKYKDNSTKNPKHVPVKTTKKLDLGSNWDRYEVEDSEAPFQDVATDFGVLASAPITVGSHFQFKGDKLEQSDSGNVLENGLFALNLDQLHYSMLSLPFYRRIPIGQELFKVSQIKEMNDSAARNGAFYCNYLETNHKVSGSLKCDHPESSEESDLDEDVITESVGTLNEVQSKVELEEWLEDILDD